MGFWFMLAAFAVTTIANEFIRPKPEFEDARPSSKGDFRVPTVTEGRPLPVIWGTVRLDAPNTGWFGDFRPVPIRKKQKTGIISSTRVTVGYNYFVGIQLDYCLGTVGEFKRFWYGKDLLASPGLTAGGTFSVNEPEFLGGDDLGSGGVIGTFHFTTGAQTSANSYLSNYQSIDGETPQYRGVSQVIFAGVYVGNQGNLRNPAAEFERIPDDLDLATVHPGENDAGDHIVNLSDANPANVIYEILTNDEWGTIREPSSRIDLSSFRTAGGTFADEGNGFSFIWDTQRQGWDMIREVERQCDCVLYFDKPNDVWKINLVRGGYTVGSVPQITDSTALEIESFSRSGWENTTNEVRVKYADRAKEYTETFAGAQNTANHELQGNLSVSTTEEYPGVKDATLANAIASRSLRTLSAPLARLSCKVDRNFYAVVPGDVVAYTSTKLGITQLPMRVQRIDYGTLDDPRITLDLVEDIFETTAGVYADPAGTGWTAPQDALIAIPANETICMEAPRGVILRDTDGGATAVPNRILTGAAYQSDGAVDYRIFQNESGSYVEDGTSSFGFLLLGELRTAISAGTTNPTTVSTQTIEIDPANDTVADIFAELLDDISSAEVGQQVLNLLYVGDQTATVHDGEFLCPTQVSDQTTHIDCDVVHRGIFDTVPQDHDAGTSVYLVFTANALSQSSLPATGAVNVKLRSRSLSDELSEGDATTLTVTMADRYRAPYPPTAMQLNNTLFDPTVDLDDFFDSDTSSGTDYEQMGLQVEFNRRDYRTFDEVVNNATDALTADANFLTDTSTEYQVSVYNDPAGTNNLLVTKAWDGTSGNDTFEINRTEILNAMTTPGAVPSTLRVLVETRHTIDGDVVTSVNDIDFDTASSSTALANDTNGGAVAQNAWATVDASAPDTGTYTISIGSAFPTNGDVEVRLNGGGASVEIAFGATTGTFSATAGDTIEVRHTSSDGSLEKFVQVDPPTSTAGGYAIFI